MTFTQASREIRILCAFPDNRRKTGNTGIYGFGYILSDGMNETGIDLTGAKTMRYRYTES